MIQKWKTILTNWINCFTTEDDKTNKITLEALLNIILHLRANFSLDESKSSLIEAHTVAEFIAEKYPEFKFDNGSFEPTTEEEIYIATSLLLLFICVNSKNLDLKSAMCSKLNIEDQEIILKFSKMLMEFSSVTYRDVQAAILESCGQDIASPQVQEVHPIIPETPPALRSLHGEVRRLRAALDSERFDRNYLQDELSRTVLKMEKLTQDKEQYKMEIMNLKAKISMCCGDEAETQTTEERNSEVGKLRRQLEEMEDRLVDVQGKLDEILLEKDSYKAKVEDLKRERDKCLDLIQQEITRNLKLSEELDVEKRNVQSLRDLVVELQQHNRLNGLDCSQLECDDPDASVHLLQNTSICSEVCANVVEVQLLEERAKIVDLKDQIQILQGQLSDLEHKTTLEKQNLEAVICEKDTDILNLKHRINEEIEEKTNMKSQFNDKLVALNNEINELEQKLKDNTDYSRILLETKMKETQILQEEKLSLLQSLSDETTKLETMIENLKTDLETEKSSKLKLKEDYDTHIMKLNQKILNRNNELVELQNNISEQSEMIEKLHLDLRNEKEQMQFTENHVKDRMEEINTLKHVIQEKQSALDRAFAEIADLKYMNADIEERYILLESSKETEVHNRDTKIAVLEGDIQRLNKTISEIKEEYLHNLDERDAVINTLQMQLQDEIKFKIGLQNELEAQKSIYLSFVKNSNETVTRLEADIINKDKTIEGVDLCLKNEKHEKEELIQRCDEFKEQIKVLTNEMDDRCNAASKILQDTLLEHKSKCMELENSYLAEQNKLMSIIEKLEESLNEKNTLIDDQVTQIQELVKKVDENNNLLTEMKEEKEFVEENLKEEIENRYKAEEKMKNLVKKLDEIMDKNCVLNGAMMKEKQENSIVVTKLKEENKILDEKLKEETSNRKELENNMNTLQNMVKVFEVQNCELKNVLQKETQEKDSAIAALQKENECLLSTIEEDSVNHEIIIRDKDSLINTLKQEIKGQTFDLHSFKEESASRLENLNKDMDEKRMTMDTQIFDLNNELKRTLSEYDKVNSKFEHTEKELKLLINQNNLITERKAKLDFLLQEKESEIEKLKSEKLAIGKDLESFKNQCFEMESKCRKLLEEKNKVINENESLTQQISMAKSIIYRLKNENETIVKEQVLKENEWSEKFKLETSSKMNLAQEKEELMVIKVLLENKLLDEQKAKLNVENKLTRLIQEKENLKQELMEVKDKLIQELSDTKNIKDILFKEKETLLIENEAFKREIMEQKTKFECLLKDFDIIKAENESLLKKLEHEKAACDELENDKKVQEERLKEVLREKGNEVCIKREEVRNMEVEINNVKSQYKDKERTINNMTEYFAKSIDKIISKLTTEDISNEALRKLSNVENISQMSLKELSYMIINISDALTTELSVKNNLERALLDENTALTKMQELYTEKEMQILELKTEIKKLHQEIHEQQIDLSKTTETYETSIQCKVKDIQNLQLQNKNLCNELNDAKEQLETKVLSLKEKLVDNENLTEKLKKTYECQIDNLNLMITKLSGYLKDKSVEIDLIRSEKEKLQLTVNENLKVIKSLDNEVKLHKTNEEKLISDFESERLVLKNMVSVTESVMEDQKSSLNKVIEQHLKSNEVLEQENKNLQEAISQEKRNTKSKLLEKETVIETMFKELSEVRSEKTQLEKEIEIFRCKTENDLLSIKEELNVKVNEIQNLEKDKNELANIVQKHKYEITLLEEKIAELKTNNDSLEVELTSHISENGELKNKIQVLTADLDKMKVEKEKYEKIVSENSKILEENKLKLDKFSKETEGLKQLRNKNREIVNTLENNKKVIQKLEENLKQEQEQNKHLTDEASNDKLLLTNKCSILSEYQAKAELFLEERNNEITSLQIDLNTCKNELGVKNQIILEIEHERDQVRKELEICKCELELKYREIEDLRRKLDEINLDAEALKVLRKENEELIKAIGQRETFMATDQGKLSAQRHAAQEVNNSPQVDTTPSDIAHSSTESIKTISDLEKIVQDKNRTITTLQSDITYLKSLVAESENKLLDVTKELEISKENCQQLSNQLKKIVHTKNEEIADLKKQMNKMSVTENRVSQIIKVSAKYQAIILKRIAEIKSNTVLKELTNFGNLNCESELRQSLAGSVTMEDLESFLETTDRHLRRCSEKQLALQKERDRLLEVNRINESEIVNMKKFLTELSISFKTFSSVRDVYTHKLSKVISLQRTTRREILSLDGHTNDATMCKLERGYAAVIQDLSECVMNLERWVERSICRTVSAEKIKQAFTTDEERTSLPPTTFQNASLEVQIGELENSFQKLLEDVYKAKKGEGSADPQSVTVMEVRAEYEDKLNRMKAKMKQLYQEEVAKFREKKKEEIEALELELKKTRQKLVESSKAYEEHIKKLSVELWNVGEKFLMKKDEAEWLRRKQQSGSLMSLQHVHSSGLIPPPPQPRPSDTQSLRSLPVGAINNKEGRGLHMSDEEGEVFDNRFLHELNTPPKHREKAPDQRLSELKWRNSLCPPHLKSSYPAETQFATVDEDDIKFTGTMSLGGKQQRKEVGITAYKKPGPPTPSKQAGRLSATDSELRESLRTEPDVQMSRKTSTPSRLRSLFRSNKNDTEGTPRSGRLSSIFRRK